MWGSGNYPTQIFLKKLKMRLEKKNECWYGIWAIIFLTQVLSSPCPMVSYGVL